MISKLAFKLTLLLCLSLYLTHFVISQGYAVNVPFADEWEALNPDKLSAGLSLQWLFAQHNEHRIITTKLLVWVLYKLNGWNLVTHQALNFLLYGLLLFLIVRWAKKYAPRLETWVVLSFTLFLLSPVNWENHSWGFQTSFHLSLLFLLAAIYFLYDEEQRWSGMLLGSAMAILAIYTLSSGLISSLANLLVFSLFKSRRFSSAPDTMSRKRELQQLLTVAGLIGSALALWFVDYQTVAVHPPYFMPYRRYFWIYFVNVLGLGFGLEVLAFLPNFFCLLIVITPVICDLWRKRGRPTNASWAVYAAIAGILAALFVFTIGRASFGVEQAKSSRYSEVGMMLIPLSVCAWSVCLQDKKHLRAYVLAALWLFCFFASRDSWSKFSKYEEVARQRSQGLLCIKNYYAGEGEANCPSLHPEPLATRLEQARKLNLSFYRNLPP